MDSKQKAAKKQPLTIKQLQAKNRQLKKDLDEQDRVNEGAVKTIGELRSNIGEHQQYIKELKENIALLKRQLELQAGIFARTFKYMQELQQQMSMTEQKANKP
jgi:predicted nuclease with TOPRIM domain